MGLLFFCILLLSACSVVSTPVGKSVEARLLASKLSDAEFGGDFRDADSLHFKMFEADLEAQPLSVPMDKRFRGLPAFKVNLNDRHSVNMIADTGAQLCIVDAATALAAGGRVYLPGKAPLAITGIGGNESAWIARFGHAQIGKMRLRGLTTLVRRHKTVTRFAGMKIHGMPINLIGCPIFLAFAYVTFDYARSEFIFSPGVPFRPSNRAISIPMRVHNQLITVLLRVGSHTVEAVVDTGARDEIFLNTATLRRLRLEKSAERGGTYRAVGLGGEVTGRQFILPLAFVGEFPVREVVVDTGESDAWAARIGTALLEKWKVTFDFQNSRMWLEEALK